MKVAGKLAFLSFHKLWVLSHDFYWEKQTYKLYLACENTRFPSLLAAGHVSRGGNVPSGEEQATRNGCFRRLDGNLQTEFKS